MSLPSIYITYTPNGTYASQGMSPSNKEGYDIWLEQGQPWLHLGWIPMDKVHDALAQYMYDDMPIYILLPDRNNYIKVQ